MLIPVNAGTISSITRYVGALEAQAIGASTVEELANFTLQDDLIVLGGVAYYVYTNAYASAQQPGNLHRVTASATGWR